MRRVIIESPFAAPAGAWLPWLHRWRNKRYARACVRHALLAGDAPLASHLLYPQRGILRDHDPAERQWGIYAGLEWLPVADASVVYIDRGITNGMKCGIAAARAAGVPVEYRAMWTSSILDFMAEHPDGRLNIREPGRSAADKIIAGLKEKARD